MAGGRALAEAGDQYLCALAGDEEVRIRLSIPVLVLLAANACALWFLIAVITAGMARRGRRTPGMITVNHVSRLSRCIMDFHLEHGRYPRDLHELREWLMKGNVARTVFSAFTDGWGAPLRYVPHSPKINKGRFDLYSVGRNGLDEYDEEDFGDDIHLLPNDCVGYGRLAASISRPDDNK